jgi:hypothetical protein
LVSFRQICELSWKQFFLLSSQVRTSQAPVVEAQRLLLGYVWLHTPPASQRSLSPLHQRPSSQLVPTLALVQPAELDDALQERHGFDGSFVPLVTQEPPMRHDPAWTGWLQTPSVQMSCVQLTLSLQSELEMQVQPTPREGVPAHCPSPSQRSLAVQGSASLQETLLPGYVASHCPFEGLHARVAPQTPESSFVHTTAVPEHWPCPSQVSVCVHSFPSSHSTPAVTDQSSADVVGLHTKQELPGALSPLA